MPVQIKILAIETSCDETAVALLESKGGKKSPSFRVIKNLVSSQVKIHEKWGGVVPSLAKREHQNNLPFLLKKTITNRPNSEFRIPNSEKRRFFEILTREKQMAENLWPWASLVDPSKIDLIAVTKGPGLEPALWVGINTAKALAYLWQKSIVGVNHLKGHAYSPRLGAKQLSEFPVLHLIVSGGHTELVLMKNYEKFELLGETRDDAAGEAFDKVAKLLDLTYPGGPQIEKLAKEGNPKAFNFPRPMANSGDLDFSYSGLKTAVLYEIQKNKRLTKKYKADIAASFQAAVIDSLVIKLKQATERHKPKTAVISGGVSANDALYRKAKKELRNLLRNLTRPAKKYTLDNAAMIGVAGYFQYLDNGTDKWQKIEAEGGLNF